MDTAVVKYLLKEAERRAVMTFLRSAITALTKLLMKNAILRISLIIISVLFLTGISLILLISWHVERSMKKYMVSLDDAPERHTAVVLGAYAGPDGWLSAMLEDRVSTAVELYRRGKVKKLLMTGDHGEKNYDEVNSMRLYAEKKGVPTEDIFMDHAGFKTYESMFRADKVFQVKSALIVTQHFHLARAVYLARSRGINAIGVIADRRPYWNVRYNYTREIPGRVKDFFQVNFTKPLPTFLGPVISIEGDGRETHDGK